MEVICISACCLLLLLCKVLPADVKVEPTAKISVSGKSATWHRFRCRDSVLGFGTFQAITKDAAVLLRQDLHEQDVFDRWYRLRRIRWLMRSLLRWGMVLPKVARIALAWGEWAVSGAGASGATQTHPVSDAAKDAS